MDVASSYSKRSLFWIVLCLAVLCTMVNMIVYNLGAIPALIDQSKASFTLLSAFDPGMILVVLVSAAFGIMGMIMWLLLRGSVKRALKQADKTPVRQAKAGKSDAADSKTRAELKQETQRREKRIFLHLLSVFQNEGRLIDFFEENLDAYEDDQIGAAVRNIHENCRKVMNKYINCKPIVEEDEDEEMTVAAGFDPSAMKLTGNVTGDPPFTGVVRHKGWKAVKVDMPALSGEQNPDIIAPAEIEIQ